jgi:hypothetical protein
VTDLPRTREPSDLDRIFYFVALASGVLLAPMNVLFLYDRFISPVSISHAFPWEVMLWMFGCLVAALWLVSLVIHLALRRVRWTGLATLEILILAGLIAYPSAMMIWSR